MMFCFGSSFLHSIIDANMAEKYYTEMTVLSENVFLATARPLY